jgi:hypothetical protein
VQNLSAGLYVQQVAPYGNALLSTLWVKDLDLGATVKVDWYDLGPGGGEYPGERIYVASHGTISTNDTSNRIIVPRIHNKAYCEVTIVGGSATFGIYASSVADFPQAAPYLDGQIANLAGDAASSLVIFNPDDGKYYLARGPNGSLNVNVTGGSLEEGFGNPKLFTFRGVTTPTINQVVISQSVPSNKTWKLRTCKIISRCYGEFLLKVNSDIIGEGKSSQAESNPFFTFAPYYQANFGDVVSVEFIQNYGPAMNLAAYLQLTEQTV